MGETSTVTPAGAGSSTSISHSLTTPSPSTSLNTTSHSTSAIPTSDLSTSSSSQPSAAVSSASTSIIPSGTVHPTSDKASKSNASGNRYSTGALAGSIVGSFLGGCIIAFLVAFLIVRRRKRAYSHSEKGEHFTSGSLKPPEGPAKNLNKVTESSVSTKYEGISYVSSNAMTSKSFDLSPYVPEPADDTTVCTRIQTFFDQASLHIDNYYARPDSACQLKEEDIIRITDYDSLFLGAPLASLLSRPRTQRTVLTHTLIHTLLQGIRPGNQTRSLLPACYDLDRSPRASDSRTSDEDRATFAWRMLTSHLLILAQNSQSTDLAVHNEVITKIADDFNQTFAPYGDPRFTKADRIAHLHTIVREASRLGVWLFAQPCSFEFHWSMPSKTGSQITVLPSVIKIYDEQGRHLAVPQTVLDETKAQI